MWQALLWLVNFCLFEKKLFRCSDLFHMVPCSVSIKYRPQPLWSVRGPQHLYLQTCGRALCLCQLSLRVFLFQTVRVVLSVPELLIGLIFTKECLQNLTDMRDFELSFCFGMNYWKKFWETLIRSLLIGMAKHSLGHAKKWVFFKNRFDLYIVWWMDIFCCPVHI